MIAEIKDNIIKEVRRAKRKQKWLKDNILPLSTQEQKSLQNKEYRQRIKRKQEEAKDPNFNKTYKNEVLDYITQQHYTHTGSLTYRYSRTMFTAYRDSVFMFELLRLRGIIYNYFIEVEYEDNHVHTHFIINTDLTTKGITRKLNSVYNGKYEKGYVYLTEFKDEKHYKNVMDYFTDKLNVNNRSRQSQIDYWYIG